MQHMLTKCIWIAPANEPQLPNKIIDIVVEAGYLRQYECQHV